MITIGNSRVRAFLRFFLPFFVIPAAVIAGVVFFRSSGWAYVITAVVLLTLLLFTAGCERRQTGTRRLVLTASLVAIASAGRVICSPLPGVNPITAITVLSAIYLGSETGFMIGSFSALVSGIFSGLGVWTPFQMFAWGLIGTIAGLMSGVLASHKIRLCIFSSVAGVAYSFIMDVWTVLWAYRSFSFEIYLAKLATALPYTIVYAVSNVLFVLWLERPFREKLSRIRTKYGI